MSMFNGTALMIDAFVERLEREYSRNYGTFAPQYGEILGWAGRMALERRRHPDALAGMDHRRGIHVGTRHRRRHPRW